MKTRDKFMLELIIGLFIIFLIIAYGFYVTNKRDKLMQEGRPVIATIVNIRPVSTDDSGNTTIVYVLDIEGHLLKGSEKIDTFYAPQLQPGKKIKVMYKDDENYMFLFEK
ncbi:MULTISPECIES: hypothetical protein [Kosakonia]|uniref:hypothetical protein n=1 Tax=Kosakonia TaxID=1330547 RepID=UPI0022E75281|nr:MULTISPECIES: hypothetical protein [Kosakonia]MDY0886185.1 hypothetical protein [Kosakonia sp. CFBP8986]